jgi:hypothetical protein
MTDERASAVVPRARKSLSFVRKLALGEFHFNMLTIIFSLFIAQPGNKYPFEILCKGRPEVFNALKVVGDKFVLSLVEETQDE